MTASRVSVSLSLSPFALGIVLVSSGVWATAAIICREITMSAVREWAANLGKKAKRSVDVSDWGKYKTGIQVLHTAPIMLSKSGL